MKKQIEVTDLDSIKDMLVAIVAASSKKPFVQYIDVRIEAGEGIGAYVEDTSPKGTSKDWNLSMGVRVIGGEHFPASGFYGRALGIIDFQNFEKVLQEAIGIARERAILNA